MQQSRNTEISDRYVSLKTRTLPYPMRKENPVFKELVGQLSKLCISNCVIWLLSLHAYTSRKRSKAPTRMAERLLYL